MNPMTVKRTPVLMARVEGGIINSYNKYKCSPFGTYYMGGDMMSGSMSYMNETIGLYMKMKQLNLETAQDGMHGIKPEIAEVSPQFFKTTFANYELIASENDHDYEIGRASCRERV